MSREIINLIHYCQNGNFELTTTTTGVAVRNASGLDKFVSQNRPVTIVIPEQIFALGIPFLQELLENSIMHCEGDMKKFHELVKFKCEGRYDISFDLKKVIDGVLAAEYQ